MKPLPLLALACALVAPVSAHADGPFDASKLLVLDSSQFGTGPAGSAIKQACPDGTLVVYKDEAANAANSFSAKIGYNVSVPIYCAHVNADKTGRLDPVPGNILDLTVYYPHLIATSDPWSQGADFRLNRSPRSTPVQVRIPLPTDFVPGGPGPSNPPDTAGLYTLAGPSGDTRDPQLMNNACPKGTVILKGADLAAAQGKSMGSTVAVPLYCGNTKDGKPVFAPLTEPKLTAFIQGNHVDLRLNRGASPDYPLTAVAFDAKNLKPVSDNPTPGPGPDPRPRPGPGPGPGPGPHLKAVALTAHEKIWLTFDEELSYKAAHAAVLHKPVADQQKVYALYRSSVTANMRAADAQKYQSVYDTNPSSTALENAVKAIPAYSGAEVALSTDDQAKLTPTQKTQYLADIAATNAHAASVAPQISPKHATTDLVALHYVVLKYKPGGDSPTPAPTNAGPWPPLDKGLAPFFSSSEWDAYSAKDDDLRKQYAKAAHDGTASAAQLADLIKQINDNEKTNLGILAHDLQKNKVDLATINGKVMPLLADPQKSYMCDAIVKAEAMAGAAAPAGEIRTDTGSGRTDLTATTGSTASLDTGPAKAIAAKDHAAVTGSTATAPSAPVAPANNPAKITTNSPVYQACAGSAQPAGPVGPVGPGGGTTDLNGTIPPPPNGIAQGDSDPTPAKKDPNTMAHVRSGLGGVLVGLVFGTFFGPVGVLVGAAIGFGVGYAADKYLITGSS